MSKSKRVKAVLDGFSLVPMGNELGYFERQNFGGLRQFRADRKRLADDYKNASVKMLKLLADYFDKQRPSQHNPR